MYRCHKPYLQIFRHILALSGFSPLLSRYPLPLLRLWLCSTVQLGLSLWPRELDKPPWPWRWRGLLHSSETLLMESSWKIKLSQKPVGRIANESLLDHIFMQSFCSSRRHFTWGNKPFSLLFITDWTPCTRWKVSDCRHIVYLICVSNARVLTKSVKIDQSEGTPNLDRPERPFVKFAHRCSLTSLNAIFYFFACRFPVLRPD